MAKRQKLIINSEDLVQNLRQSAGKGVDAFFSSPSPTPNLTAQPAEKYVPQPKKTALERVETSQVVPHENRPAKTPKEEKQASKQEINIAINIVCNIAILQTDLYELLSVAYKAQTFRFTPEELKQLREVSYSLSNLLEKKVGQADLLRLGFFLLRKLLDTNNKEVIAILQAIKK
jgi:hypothetical protein